ncbi:MAG: RNB domain-containing ribonuclease, partial [Planctomycetota bacterium]
MPEVFKENILRLLRHSDYRPLKVAQLAKEIGVSEEDYPQFKKAFEQLRDSGGITTGGGGVVSLPPLKGRIIGTFRLNPKGFGFVIPREPMRGDLFIPPKYTADAMTGDVVAAKVLKTKGKRGGEMLYSGEVIEILERANNRFVGTLLKKKMMWFVVPDGKQFLERIYVDDVTAKGTKEKDKVVVEIISYPSESEPGRGAIIEVLGKAGRYESEIRSVIRQFHLPDEFDEQCQKQAREAGAKFNAEKANGRENVTDKTIITIDPPDAKDFDDAISLEKDDKDRWILGVHIADVSYFVKADTGLDEEAKLRGNSVYLPGKTIPMLPEVLSNGVCSLQQGQNRFVKSVYITYDDDGNVTSRRITESVMKSTQRLTYRQAERILKGHTKDIEPEVIKLLKDMDRL